ncbi:relaxase/mobilization nuclease domain-containing protein [Salipiger sp. 1_MG-2023]|uniref:relaxase/mobilization nuclease domain-containing protein n=1 Tax=Salipiger sp. 1_MG-2023 TaxID=3062665 RepID=UPI0026E324F0|nr:relaxase/mobilization nuclease domain-containing protein [Salipiger sp. 1_MG-2023]MDO6588550.1 relaxase/mobilization nuclease domain-containing protein [Salipiger sp. 1_MG-2023]
MMVRFFTHGDGSGRAAVEYLLAEEVAAYTEDRQRISGQTVRRDVLPEVLSGDPDLTRALIDSNTRKWRYTSGVVAFHAEDNPSVAQQTAVMADFEKAAFAGLESDQTNILWVRHQHMGNVELHFLIPRVELHHNRSFNPAPPGSEAYFNAFRDYWNVLAGWVSPEEICRKRMIKPVLDFGDRKQVKETIQTLIVQQIEAGDIRNHADVRAVLAELDGLEFKPLSEKQLEKRRKLDAEEARGGKPRKRDTRITMRVAGASDSQNTFRLEGRIFHEDWTADEYFAAKLAGQGRDTNSRDRSPNSGDAGRFRAAFDASVERRAAKNHARYVRPRKAERNDPGPDRQSSRGTGAQDTSSDSGAGREPEGMAHSDVEDNAADLSCRGLSDLLGALDGGATVLSQAANLDARAGAGEVRPRRGSGEPWPWRFGPGAEPATQRHPRRLSDPQPERRQRLRRNKSNEVGHDTSATDAVRERIVERCRETEHDIRGWFEERQRLTERIRDFASRLQSFRDRLGETLARLGAAAGGIAAIVEGWLTRRSAHREKIEQSKPKPNGTAPAPFSFGPKF